MDNDQSISNGRIAALKQRLDRQRPLSPQALSQLDAWYNQEITWSSNAIEGNTLTRQESTLVINEGITVGGKKLKDHLEAVDHFDAVKTIRDIASQQRSITEADVIRLHEIILKRSDPAKAGRYATDKRRVEGSTVIFPNPAKIPALMQVFAGRLGKAKGFEAAFEAHFELVSIHPFIDGNGRTARLLMNALLIRDGYTPVLIGPPERANYLDVVQNRQLAEPLGHGMHDPKSQNNYLRFMTERLEKSLSDYVSFLEQDGPEKDRIARQDQSQGHDTSRKRTKSDGRDWP